MGTQLEMFDENGKPLHNYQPKVNKQKVDNKTAKWITKGTVKKLGIKKA